MLYNEFLNGTGTTANPWTYSEYKRIEKIYNDNNNMSKEDAYRLYEAPNPVVSELIEEVSFLRSLNSQKEYKISKLNKSIEELKNEISSLESVRNSLQYTLQECLTESKQAANRISNLIYG